MFLKKIVDNEPFDNIPDLLEIKFDDHNISTVIKKLLIPYGYYLFYFTYSTCKTLKQQRIDGFGIYLMKIYLKISISIKTGIIEDFHNV